MALWLVGMAWKATLVMAVAWAVTALMRRWPAAARHLVWTGAFTMLLVLPVAELVAPRLWVPVDFGRMGTVARFEATSTGGVSAPAAAVADRGAAPSDGGAPVDRASGIRWSAVLAGLWGAGAMLALLRMAAALAQMWRVRRGGRTMEVDAPFAAGAEVLEVPRGMPVVFGVLRPVVLLPAEVREWSPERRRVVLLHELAHVERGDVATHLLARTALCLHWWNPLAWIGWRAFLMERERAADDVVLSMGERASSYAGHLVEIARGLHTTGGMQWAAVAMARTSQLEERVKWILEVDAMRRNFGRGASAAAVGLALLLAIPYGAMQAQDVNTKVAPDVETAIREAAAKKNHELLDSAATHAEAMRQFDAARKLLSTSLRMRAEKDGERSVSYGLGLLQVADLERRRNNAVTAVAAYEKAAAVLGDRAEAAPALTYMGVAAASRKDFTRAEDLLKRAQLLDPARASTAMMWLALVKQHQGKADEAEGLFQAALVAESDRSWQRATILDLYANLLRAKDRGDEAKRHAERAVEVRKGLMKPVAQAKSAVRVGGGVLAPKLIAKVEPKYTDEARFAKYSGTVAVSVVVGQDGQVRNAKVVRELGLGLDERALDAISEWKFQPGTKDGQPVDVQAMIEVNFRLM